jgi:AhpD family alkylhydroperoxidase
VTERTNYAKAAPEVYKAMLALHEYLKKCGLDHSLLSLVYLRASQMNRCVFCIDMHWKDLRAMGESEEKLYMLATWREWIGFTERERAALQWTEAVTLLSNGSTNDDYYQKVREHFDERELANLTLAIATVNSWNRLNVAFRIPAGKYQAADGPKRNRGTN